LESPVTIQPLDEAESAYHEGREISLFAIGSVLLARRKTILVLGVLGAVSGAALGMLSPVVYKASATFVPQAMDGGATGGGISTIASQFGIRVPTAGSSAWGPPLYVEILKSRIMLEPVAVETLSVPEMNGRRVAVMDLLGIQAPNADLRKVLAVEALGKKISATDDNKLDLVRVSVETAWPSVSLAVAERLVRGVNRFNLETRKSQAVAEQQFVDKQATDAELALRQSENRLQTFLQENRALGGSPELSFERDRLQRDMTLRQQIYTTLLQSREEARIRVVRDVPVITVLEAPTLPLRREPRGTLGKTLLGGLGGISFGIFAAFLTTGLATVGGAADPDAAQFRVLFDEATPKFLKRLFH
jgi:uncharacterized protein involved in exopolysaccharide biosynthesis